mmetsp:Transcript_138663/g.241306  ORF Transcript_138663/g.241306 Transcript_138663/m.241306 type:complete len:105 (-) Transcript_138663:410-724(-)
MPECLASTATCRVRERQPEPHSAEHSLQIDQTLHLQSVAEKGSQEFCPQPPTSMRLALLHGLPPPVGYTAMSLVREVWPPSHERLQVLHSVQAPYWQFCGSVQD